MSGESEIREITPPPAEQSGAAAEDESGISKRTVEVTVALLLFAFGALIVYDSHRLGASWGSDGPQSGYFPFYIGVLICFSGLATLTQALYAQWRDRKKYYKGAVLRHRALFVAWGPLRQVLKVLVPALVYVLLVQLIGIYVASALYIAVFMIWLGHYSTLRSVAVGVICNVAFFAMFEIWFKVPLYKGIFDLLSWTGY